MFDDPSSRGEREEVLMSSTSRRTATRSPLRASVPSARASRPHWGWRVGSSLLLSLVLLMNVLGNMPVVQAASHAPTKLPIPNATYTLQQFLKQGHPYQPKDAPLARPQSIPASPRGVSLSTKSTQILPSAQRPTMKAASQSISVSFLQAPLVPSSLDPSITGKDGSTPALDVVGSDAAGVRLEVIVPPGALDFSKATTTRGTTPQTPLTLSITQLSGHFVGMTTELGAFQVQVTDAQGLVVHGITLHAPVTFVLHYRNKELQQLDLDPDHMLMSWPTVLTKTSTATKTATNNTASATVFRMQNDAKALTLTAQSTVLDSAVVALGISNPQNQAPPKPRFASTGGNTGQLNYSYPITVAAGPPGTVPTLALTYSSTSTNGRTSPFTPADAPGEGWELSMGTISENVEAGGAVWYSISGIDGVSDRLMPNSSTVGAGTTFATEHLSSLKIKMVSADFDSQNCFNVWDTSGTYYQFGCTHDSLQYYTDANNNRTNYRFDLDKVIPANNGNANRSITLTYEQVSHTDSNGHFTIEDAALKQISYGTSSNRAGTVDFLYKGPSNDSSGGIQWVTAYGTNEGGCSAPISTTERCDDPEPKSGGLDDPLTKSVLSLSTVKTYVGDDSSSSHLDYSYAFTYQDTPFTSCTDPQSGTSGYCAGNHLLTSITPTVYQNGTGHTLPGMTFGYSADSTRLNKYEDSSHTVPQGGDYKVQTNWRYLTSYHDHSNGVGATILYHTAYNNSNGTPYSSSDGDNRYDPLYCVWHSSDCNSGTSFYPMYNKMWTEQVVYQITSVGTDSSASSLTPGTTTYHYLLAKTSGSCAADSQGDSDCVGFGWIPDTTDGWADFYHGEFRGFGEVDILSPAGNLTVQKFYATEGWNSDATDATNYLAGSMYEEDDYQGSTQKSANLLKQTTNVFAGTNSTHTSCTSAYVSGDYSNCEVIQLSSKTTTFEGTGTSNTNAPWVQTTDSYDDYSSSSGLISGKYHNKLSEVTTSSNAPTKTQNWTYQTTDTTVGGNVYYNVHTPIHTEVVDASGHKWSCSDTTYDEGEASGLPSPAAGLATTTKTYSNCADSSTAITTYTGYDANGNAVATVDGVGTANPSLYSSNGCTLATAPAYLSSNWTAGHYTTCTAYDATSALPTDTWNAFSNHTSATYDTTQGLLQTSITDVNSQVTTQSVSYDSSGNNTTDVKLPGEANSYSQQGTLKSTCTDSSTLPCLEVDGNNSLYSSALTRTFYDGVGRKVETLTPGPDSTHTTVTFTVYNDTTNTVFTSVPFVVAARTTWLDPNGATDYNGVTPGGTSVTKDALGRTLTTTDPLSQIAATSYGVGSSRVNGDSNIYSITTSIDANGHESKIYTDMLGHTIYTVMYSGLSTGTLTAIKQTATTYNVLGKLTSISVTDLSPQSNQMITSVTTTATYDDLGRQLTLVDPDRGTHTYTYDANGNMISDTVGTRVVGSSYDLLNRVGCIQNAAPTSVSANGTCSSGATIYVQNTYDATPNGVSWSNTSYPVGKLTQSITYNYYPSPDNATGTVTENMAYDQRGHTIGTQLSIAVSGGSTLTFPTLPTYLKTQTYNDADQEVTTQTSSGGTTDYSFTQTYDSTTGVASGLIAGSTALASLSYNTNALVSGITLMDSTGANLATENLLYDGDLRPASATTTWTNGGSTIYSDGVTYDNVGNVLSRATTQVAIAGVSGSGGSEVQNFCYDEQNQLVWASNAATGTASTGQTCGTTTASGTLGGSYTNSYVYTHLGQLWQAPLNGSGAQQQYLYCNTNQPHQLTALSASSGSPTCSSQGTTTYSASYDTYGNMSSRVTGATTSSTLTYNALDQLLRWTGTTASASNEEWYLYDATGNRVLRRSTSATPGGSPATAAATITVYAFGLAEHTYTYGGSGTTATNSANTYYYSLTGRLIGASTGTNTDLFLTNLLGSVVSTVSNTSGSAAVLGYQVYGPYGNLRDSVGTMGTAKGYTGQYADDLSGLNYYVARYYDPVVGQFISADTVESNAKGMDPYAYVVGNPETKNDLTGHAGGTNWLQTVWQTIQNWWKVSQAEAQARRDLYIYYRGGPPPKAEDYQHLTFNDYIELAPAGADIRQLTPRPGMKPGTTSDVAGVDLYWNIPGQGTREVDLHGINPNAPPTSKSSTGSVVRLIEWKQETAPDGSTVITKEYLDPQGVLHPASTANPPTVEQGGTGLEPVIQETHHMTEGISQEQVNTLMTNVRSGTTPLREITLNPGEYDPPAEDISTPLEFNTPEEQQPGENP